MNKSNELQTNLTTSPGKYSKDSPIVGSRAEELKLIYRYKNIFKHYQEVVYSQQKLNIIPVLHKDKADEISKEIYAKYIEKYTNYAVTIENSVNWVDMDFTRSNLCNIENEWNTWNVQAAVAIPNHNSHIKYGMYRPAYICALHELMHIEETPRGISENEYAKFNSVIEVLTVTRTLILIDEVYKKTLDLPLDLVVDYNNSFNLFGKSIKQGELANFYRELETKYPSLAEALVSDESFNFLNRPLRKLAEASEISIMILGGFITVLGIAAVATAFILLHDLTHSVTPHVIPSEARDLPAVAETFEKQCSIGF